MPLAHRLGPQPREFPFRADIRCAPQRVLRAPFFRSHSTVTRHRRRLSQKRRDMVNSPRGWLFRFVQLSFCFPFSLSSRRPLTPPPQDLGRASSRSSVVRLGETTWVEASRTHHLWVFTSRNDTCSSRETSSTGECCGMYPPPNLEPTISFWQRTGRGECRGRGNDESRAPSRVR